MRRILLSCTVFSWLGMLSLGASAITPALHFKKVVWIIFENENASVVMQQPDFAKFASLGMSFTNFFAEAHPSQPNYVSMIAGDTLGVYSDSSVDLADTHIGDLLENAKQDWHVYAEGYPGNCFMGSSYQKYARKHVPFVSFTNVTSDAKRCAKITDATQFMQDYSSGALPAFSLYIPDMDNDGHDTDVNFAGPWLTKTFGGILSNPAALNDTLFVLTFDESELFASQNQIYTVLLGSNVVVGTNDQKLDHLSLLKLVEDELGLGNLGRGDQLAAQITNIWKN